MAEELEDLEAYLRAQIARQGVVSLAADTLASALCARCHEEVRVWAENFARTEGLSVEEEFTPAEFVFRRTEPFCPPRAY